MLPRLLFAALVGAPAASTAAAQTVCHALNDTPTFLDTVFTGNAWFAIRFDAPASFAAARVELFTGEVTALHHVDLWSHDVASGKPLALLGSGPLSITAPNAWQGADLASAVPLSAGQTYWVVWRAALGAQASLDLPGAQPGPLWTISVDSGQSWVTPVQSSDRQWKFRLFGDCCPAPLAYCSAGTTSSGCNATLTASGTASASAASGFVVSASSVEGQRQGLYFYGLSGAQAQPWGTGASWLCVKAPTQRTGAQSSGGTPLGCDGVLTLDWNAYRAAHPLALGAPFSGGESIWIQAWFRDPPAPKTTSLSDALTFSVCP